MSEASEIAETLAKIIGPKCAITANEFNQIVIDLGDNVPEMSANSVIIDLKDRYIQIDYNLADDENRHIQDCIDEDDEPDIVLTNASTIYVALLAIVGRGGEGNLDTLEAVLK